MAISNNIFPPICDTYMPAFVISQQSCRIYFSLSSYNIRSDISSDVQVAVRYQDSNQSALNTFLYPCEIMFKTLQVDTSVKTDAKYYIEISNGDLINGFEINNYYKVQLRFASSSIVEYGNSPAHNPLPSGTETSGILTNSNSLSIATWLQDNIKYFSEWSKICLIRGISKPTLTINGFDIDADYTTIAESNVDVAAILSFENENENETLREYIIQLYDDLGNLIHTSDTQYTNIYINPNEINYVIPLELESGEGYTIKLKYTTQNYYIDEVSFNFMAEATAVEDKINGTAIVKEDLENGCLITRFTKSNPETYSGSLTIRRTSELSNFKHWEDVYTGLYSVQQGETIEWRDYTVESGVFYQYEWQVRDANGGRGTPIQTSKNNSLVFEDTLFLTRDDAQLNIKYSPSISSFKYTVSENKTDTIGSKYPFVKRNGYMFYRQFPISGLISVMMDENGILLDKKNRYVNEYAGSANNSLSVMSHIDNDFSALAKESSLTPKGFSNDPSREEEINNQYKNDLIYNSSENSILHDTYNANHKINIYNDINLEKTYREFVMDFLYQDNIKLFRSATEGNILVKLMDINLTPNTQLGRQIYNFSATAYEVAECTIENFNKYGIQELGRYGDYIEYDRDYIGQLIQTFSPKIECINLITEKYQRYAPIKYIAETQYLDYLRIEMQDNPYLITINSEGQFTKATGNDTQDALLGYLVQINGVNIVINPDGIYELRGDAIQVTSLLFPYGGNVMVDYHAVVKQVRDPSTIFSSTHTKYKMGQLWGHFNSGYKIISNIYNKYYFETDSYIETLTEVNALRIEAPVGTILYLKDNGDQQYDRHLVGPTGLIEFYAGSNTYGQAYFGGMHFFPYEGSPSDDIALYDNYYIDKSNTLYTSIEEIEVPLEKRVYSINNQKKIYYNGNWYNINNTGDAVDIGFDGLVDYSCAVLKKVRA